MCYFQKQIFLDQTVLDGAAANNETLSGSEKIAGTLEAIQTVSRPLSWQSFLPLLIHFFKSIVHCSIVHSTESLVQLPNFSIFTKSHPQQAAKASEDAAKLEQEAAQDEGDREETLADTIQKVATVFLLVFV